MKILMVDDNEAFIEALVEMFTFHGYKYRSASNGIDALKAVKEFMPDMVILDIMMPRMNGLEVCGRIKSNPSLRHIHIMVMSAKDTLEDRDQAMHAGADDYYIKPFAPDEILEKITRLERVAL